MKRVVITGIAPITAIGQGKTEFFENLLKKNTFIKRLPDNYCTSKVSTEWYVPYPEVDFSQYGREVQKMLSRGSRNACTSVVSALMAIKDASLEKLEDDTVVFFGAGAPNIAEVYSLIDDVNNGKSPHPCANPMMMINSISAWISIILGVHGKNQIFSTACASGTTAIGEAYSYISSGKGKMAICGGADYMCRENGAILKSFDVLRALTKSNDGYPRPFSQERSGFLFSEGAACSLILEEYEYAKKRGADIYAEITGYECSCDGYHIVQMPPEPEQIIKIIRNLAKNEKIDYYNAHGTATIVNDNTETKVLKEVFGDGVKKVYVTSTKGIIGHSVGASGAIEAAVCAYSIKNNIVHGNILGTPIEGLCLPDRTIETKVDCAISASFGFGGHNTALKFKKVL